MKKTIAAADMKQTRAIWRAFSRLSEDAKRPTLRWLADRYTAEEAAKTRAQPPIVVPPSAHAEGTETEKT